MYMFLIMNTARYWDLKENPHHCIKPMYNTHHCIKPVYKPPPLYQASV